MQLVAGEIIECAREALAAKYAGAPTTATFIGPITRTAIMSAADPVSQPDSGVESLCHDVDGRIVHPEFEVDVG